MLSPKRTKFRKAHKGRIHGVSKGGTQLNFGYEEFYTVVKGRQKGMVFDELLFKKIIDLI